MPRCRYLLCCRVLCSFRLKEDGSHAVILLEEIIERNISESCF